MKSLIVVVPEFDIVWPFAADHLARLWRGQGETVLIRTSPGEGRGFGALARAELGEGTGDVTRIAVLGAKATEGCSEAFPAVREIAFSSRPAEGSGLAAELARRGVEVYGERGQGFWGQSVAEFALGLTIAALRRIPQTHKGMLDDPSVWDYSPPGGVGKPGVRGYQFGDDARFANGTISGKRVRVIGMGNIGARYAGWCAMMGADVAGWDPVAADPAFHRTGTRRVLRLEELVTDAEILAPMLPLVPKTTGLVNAALLRAVPRGALLLLVTRMQICDVAVVRERVLADELSLAADVFDVEPLPAGDPLLGRHNVVHTPHNAGRTIDSNQRYAEELAQQFRRT